MPDVGSDHSDTMLSWLRDLVATRLGVEPAAIDPGQRLHRCGLTSLTVASIVALIADRSGRALPAMLGNHVTLKRSAAVLDNEDDPDAPAVAMPPPVPARPLPDRSLSMSRVGVQIDSAPATNLKVALSVIGDTLATILGERDFSHFFWLPDALRGFEQLPAVQLIATLMPGASLGRVIASPAQAAQQTLSLEFACDFACLSCQTGKAGAQVGLVFPPALELIYLLLAAQFESFDGPVIVLITVPFAIGGALRTVSVPLVYSSISGRMRVTLPEPPAQHPKAVGSGGLLAVPGE